MREVVLRISGVTFGSRSNGPGARTVIHFQGCSIGCPGCFNKKTWNSKGGDFWHVPDLARHALSKGQDITISGGEPTEQWDELISFLKCVRLIAPERTIVMYTGVESEKLIWSGKMKELEKYVDLLIAGPYVSSQKVDGPPLISSYNQERIFISDRIKPEDLEECPRVELTYLGGGEVRIMGFPETDDRGRIKTKREGV